MIGVNLTRLASIDEVSPREYELLTTQNRDLLKRFPLVAELLGGPVSIEKVEPGKFITVAELAEAIGQTERAARRLLERGEIPGARRTTPGVKNSPWLIPAEAPAKYVTRHEGRTNGTR